MKLSSLNLVDYKVKLFSFETLEDINSEELDIGAAKISCTNILRGNRKNTSQLMVGLKINISNQSHKFFPYIISFEICGIFDISQISDEYIDNEVILRSGTSILMGVSREIIYTMTAHGIYGPLMLPTFSLLPHARKKVQKCTMGNEE